MGLFLPKQTLFFEKFKEMQAFALEMSGLFEKLTRNFSNFRDYAKQAQDIEHKADEKTHEIIQELNRTFITPIDREDIYFLANELDDIIDLMENAINNIFLYKITQADASFPFFARLMAEASRELGELLDCLEQGKYTERLAKVKVRMHELEDESDEIFESAISRLFSNGSDPVNIVKLKDILENLEHIMDKFQKVADGVEGVVVKSS